MTYIKYILIFTIILVNNLSSQNRSGSDLEAFIEIEKTEYEKYSSKNGNDSLIITLKIKNTGNDTVLFRMADEFDLGYSSNFSSHCFRINPHMEGLTAYQQDYERNYNSFVKIAPGEEVIAKKSYYLTWLCRSMPPRKEWNFKLSYYREITDDDNYLMIKSMYSDSYTKEYIKAWTGTITSNKIEISFE